MVRHCSKQTEPAPDGTHYIMLQHLHPPTVELILCFLNKMRPDSHFAFVRKVDVVMFSLKSGKEPSCASSYSSKRLLTNNTVFLWYLILRRRTTLPNDLKSCKPDRHRYPWVCLTDAIKSYLECRSFDVNQRPFFFLNFKLFCRKMKFPWVVHLVSPFLF